MYDRLIAIGILSRIEDRIASSSWVKPLCLRSSLINAPIGELRQAFCHPILKDYAKSILTGAHLDITMISHLKNRTNELITRIHRRGPIVKGTSLSLKTPITKVLVDIKGDAGGRIVPVGFHAILSAIRHQGPVEPQNTTRHGTAGGSSRFLRRQST